MATEEKTNAVRDEFSKLSLDGKTSFLVEAVFSTAGTAIHEIGTRLTNLVELVTGATDHSNVDAEAPAASDSDPTSEGDHSEDNRSK